jgi:hypothetical protein
VISFFCECYDIDFQSISYIKKTQVLGSITGISKFKFKNVGFYHNTSRNKCWQIQIIVGRRNLDEETQVTQIKDIFLNVKDCSKFDTLFKEKILNQH